MTRKNQNQKVTEDQMEVHGPDATSADLTMEQMMMLMMQKQQEMEALILKMMSS